MACAHPGIAVSTGSKDRVVEGKRSPVDWYMGMDSESLEMCVSYSERLPPMKQPTLPPTTVCLGIPELSSASNVHSSNSLC